MNNKQMYVLWKSSSAWEMTDVVAVSDNVGVLMAESSIPFQEWNDGDYWATSRKDVVKHTEVDKFPRFAITKVRTV